MRPDQRDVAHLWDMLDRARSVQQFVEGISFRDYVEDKKLQAAVERCVEVIGEAANRVSRAFQQAHPEIPWRAIIAQRHVLAHDYDEVRPERVYRVATVHVPDLIATLEPLVPETPPERPDA